MASQAQHPEEPDAPASVAGDGALTPGAPAGGRRQTAQVRRSPKYSVFLIAGAALGILTALILTFVFDGTVGISPNTGLVYSQSQVFGFVALICVTVGVVVGGIVALILDRVLGHRTREVTVARERIHIEE